MTKGHMDVHATMVRVNLTPVHISKGELDAGEAFSEAVGSDASKHSITSLKKSNTAPPINISDVIAAQRLTRFGRDNSTIDAYTPAVTSSHNSALSRRSI
ncbi:MAG: hypothetical protein ACFFCO_09210, partial [Promethearchaeota archaeon]